MNGLKKYFPNLTQETFRRWVDEKKIEMRILNGQERYFRNALSNFFRADPEARTVKEAADGKKQDLLNMFLSEYLSVEKENSFSSPHTQLSPRDWTVTYTLTVNANAVADGEWIRCWLPFPRTDNRRQTSIRMLSVNSASYRIAPDDFLHKTIYMEKRVQKDQPTVFSFRFSMRTVGEKFHLISDSISPYDTSTSLYRTFTAQRNPHILFTLSVRELSAHIIGNETHPLKKAEKIYNYICRNYPWTSAPEYSIVENIPQYVMDYRRGDCGMVSLLFITLCRYNGIPAKWQSGFMLHPGHVNLHDWAEIYFEQTGWVPVDVSFGRRKIFADKDVTDFYFGAIDAYRWTVNDDFGVDLFPNKTYFRSETIDFQRGEVEFNQGNLYFDQWKWNIKATAISAAE
jgi:transglutaminase-like putative cysteine protease